MAASRLESRVEMVRKSLAGEGGRPPFTEMLSQGDALAFWRRHFDDDIGRKLRREMSPQDQVELQTALAGAIEAEQSMEVPYGGP